MSDRPTQEQIAEVREWATTITKSVDQDSGFFHRATLAILDDYERLREIIDCLDTEPTLTLNEIQVYNSKNHRSKGYLVNVLSDLRSPAPADQLDETPDGTE